MIAFLLEIVIKIFFKGLIFSFLNIYNELVSYAYLVFIAEGVFKKVIKIINFRIKLSSMGLTGEFKDNMIKIKKKDESDE